MNSKHRAKPPVVNLRVVIENNIKEMFSRFNEDFFFKNAEIRFSRRFDHFLDRLFDRKFNEVAVIRALKKHVSDKKCEIIYCCHLTNPPLRCNIVTDEFIICFSIFIDGDGKKQLKLRTITENNNTQSKISTYIL